MLDSGETSEPPEERGPTPSSGGPPPSSSLPDRFSRVLSDPQWRVVAGVLAVVAVVALAAPYLPGKVGIVSAGGASVHAAGQGTAGAKPGPATAKPIPPTPEQLATGTSVAPKLAAALRTWDRGPGGRELVQIQSDVGAALQSGGMKSYAVMKVACASTGTSVSAAAARPPIPDATMQSKYSAALSMLAKGASDCRSAITEQRTNESVSTKENPTTLQLAQSEMNSGITSLAAITVVLNAAVAAS